MRQTEGGSMATVTDELLQQMVRVIVEEADPEQVYLFGSHARGEARDDSDVDLLIVEREPFGPQRSRRQEAGRLWRVLAGFAPAKDIILCTSEELAQRRDSRYNVIGRAVREGRLLYARS
jgi:predicted nucleotidyltransferase